MAALSGDDSLWRLLYTRAWGRGMGANALFAHPATPNHTMRPISDASVTPRGTLTCLVCVCAMSAVPCVPHDEAQAEYGIGGRCQGRVLEGAGEGEPARVDQLEAGRLRRGEAHGPPIIDLRPPARLQRQRRQ
jgi:hypothetical protein